MKRMMVWLRFFALVALLLLGPILVASADDRVEPECVPQPPKAIFDLSCTHYQLGIEAMGCEEQSKVSIVIKGTHRLGSFNIKGEVSTEPGTANSAMVPLPKPLYGHVEAEGVITTFCGEEQIQEEWVLNPLKCGEYLAKCNETCSSAGFQCEEPWICILSHPGLLGSDKCRNPYNPNSEACSPGKAGCYEGCDPDGLLGSCEKGLICLPFETGDGMGFIPTIQGICVHPLHPEALDCLPPEESEDFVPQASAIFLLGTGLIGLAGYAHLRLRRNKNNR